MARSHLVDIPPYISTINPCLQPSSIPYQSHQSSYQTAVLLHQASISPMKSSKSKPCSHTTILSSSTALKCSPYGLFPYFSALSFSCSLSIQWNLYAISSGAEIDIP